MIKLDPKIEEYIRHISDKEDEILHELFRETHLKIINPRMVSGYLQGKLLETFSKMKRPDQILEIGTFTGYSAICLAKGLKEGGLLHTIEINEELAGFPDRFVRKLNMQGKIKFYIGDALGLIDGINENFDLVFIDGDKRQYTAYYKKVIEKVKTGGYILVDNVLWDGKVVNERPDDSYTKGIMDFNDYSENLTMRKQNGFGIVI